MSNLKEILINKKNCKSVWFMRQAGRYLPEFRKIRADNKNFINLCLNSELSSQITLQPIKRFDFDSAIIFSDILMIPYALGQNVEFEKAKVISQSILNIKGVRSSTIINKNFTIACKEGAIIPIFIQREGKKVVSLEDFLRGFTFSVQDELNA